MRGEGRGPAHVWDLLRGAQPWPTGTAEMVRCLCRCRRVGSKMRRLVTVIQQSEKEDRPRKHTGLSGGTKGLLRPVMSLDSGQSEATHIDKGHDQGMRANVRGQKGHCRREVKEVVCSSREAWTERWTRERVLRE